MKLNAGVEWVLHTCLNLGWIEEDTREGASTARLAAFYHLPPAYLGKQLQALVRAGILTSTSGPRGGFRLARRLEDISVLDVVTAIEGRTNAFECTQILHDGPGANPATDYRTVCAVSQTMSRADLAWRRELASETLADIRDRVLTFSPGAPRQTRAWFENTRA
ncbi:RrF2 family transcriptional regulator [Actinoplanes couchii]|uniref:Rrf2 family transcriptional regulator n=1 Tax=Actinoplanes couchii TaxID=403638 RepID=A0ABQ3XP05_9ACTN|nr:Rrf2 family transcriptional regulator [Actinoplanes couchii]MDR6318591.1 Rrf2 family protein [Actinoplanes couchii]GID60200.1 Rrf2 family transcriptional regulator [Actinoplanes couchii]